MKQSFKFCFYSSIILILASCAAPKSTSILSSWTKEGYTAQKYSKVLVLAIGKNTSGRAIVEGTVSDRLKRMGVNAVAAINIFPNYNPEVKLEQSFIDQKLKENNIEGLMILSLLNVKSEQVYVPGQTYTQPTGGVYYGYSSYPNGYYNSYHPYGYNNGYYGNYGSSYGYYSAVYQTVQEPGYYEDQTTFYLESNFYKVNSDGLVWSGQCKTQNPSDIGTAAKEWSDEIVYSMKRAKIFK